MPDHPLHKHLQNLTKKRLKRTSLNHVLKEQQRKESDILAPRPEFSIPGISTKSSDSEASLKTLTLAEVDKSYPATAWTQFFTDGSAENASRNGGCGIYIGQPNKPLITIAIPGRNSAQTTGQKHKHSSLQQRLSPSWRKDQRRLCSSQIPYLYCNHLH